MTGILGITLPGGIAPMLIGGLAIAAVSATGASVLTHKLDGISLAHSQTETANAKAALSAYGASVAASTAKANADAIAEQGRLQSRLNDLQNQLAQTQKAENAKSARLQALLASGKPGDERPIGPLAGEYYRQLRSQPPAISAHP